ncbi:MAG: hypothetical protein MJ211_11565 [Bacteroidales bacterium]|nr:hypothetical protein [Bacteroidales bacterium]
MKKILTILAIISLATNLNAQNFDDEDENEDFIEESNVEFNIGVDLWSSYVDRGVKSSDGLNIQPSLDFCVGGFFTNLWGSSDFEGNFKEFDISLGYQTGPVSFYITDYYINEDCKNEKIAYSNWKSEETAHTLEGTIDFETDFGLDASLNLLFYGDDKKEDEDGNIKNNYSTYFEIGYTATIGEVDLRPCVGMTFKESSWYGDCSMEHKGFNVVNIGLGSEYQIKIGNKFKIPVFVNTTYNPQEDDIYFYGGFRIGM